MSEAYIQSNPREILNNTSLGEAFAASSDYGQNPARALGNRTHYVRVMSRSWYRQNPTHDTALTAPQLDARNGRDIAQRPSVG